MNYINETMVNTLPDFCREVVQTVQSSLAPKKMREKIGDYHEKDIAAALEQLAGADRERLLRMLPASRLAAVLEYAENAALCFAQLSIQQKAEVLSCMESQAAVELLRQLPKGERTGLMELLPGDVCQELRLIGSFEEENIGSRMSTNFITIPENATVKEAMSSLIHQAAEHDHIATLYLVDEGGVFTGAIDLKDLILAREGTPLAEITTVAYPYVYARTPIADCLPLLADYGEASIPVLDDVHRLLGVVTAQDVAELIDDAMGDDYAKLGGLSSEEDLAEPIAQSVKKRMPWLGILLVMGLGVSATVGMFESIVAQLPIIMCFQSLILDMAGNVGTQSLAVAIRVLMDTRIDRKGRAKLVWKEARVGLLNGGILGALSVGVIGGYLMLLGNEPAFAFAVSGCLGLAMVTAMVVSALSGTLIPIFFQRVGVDPAVASGPLITTVNDLVAVITYYGLAWLILINGLHLA